jgi:hypothetical protein
MLLHSCAAASPHTKLELQLLSLRPQRWRLRPWKHTPQLLQRPKLLLRRQSGKRAGSSSTSMSRALTK